LTSTKNNNSDANDVHARHDTVLAGSECSTSHK